MNHNPLSSSQLLSKKIKKSMLDIIVAHDLNRGIGYQNQLPWQLPADLKYFKKLTTTTQKPSHQNAVIMGRKTWDSIPAKYRPLPERLNIVLSRQKKLNVPAGVLHFSDLTNLHDSLSNIKEKYKVEHFYIIGGSQLYSQCLEAKLIKHIYITKIEKQFTCDSFFPEYENTYSLTENFFQGKENNIPYSFLKYRVNLE